MQGQVVLKHWFMGESIDISFLLIDFLFGPTGACVYQGSLFEVGEP